MTLPSGSEGDAYIIVLKDNEGILKGSQKLILKGWFAFYDKGMN